MRRGTGGVLVGILAVAAGGWSLWRAKRDPIITISVDDQRRSAADGADPTPAAGTRVLRPLDLDRTRQVVKAWTTDDPVVQLVGSVGFDGVASLHLIFQNRGTCKVTSVAGVAYGFDAWRKPGQLNKHGEHYLAFRADKLDIEPGKKGRLEAPLHFTETASLVVAHFDEVICADGARWNRR